MRDALTLGPWRRRRRMRRLLAELDVVDDSAYASHRRSRSRERMRSVVVVLMVVALLMVAWRVNSPTSRFALRDSDPVRLAPAGPVGPGLVRPEQVESDAGTYRLGLERTDGTPVAYSSCRPVRLVHSTDGAPDGADDLLTDAVAEVEEASGLDLEIVGDTDERPRDDRPLRLEEYGDDWAPSLVSWSDPSESPRLEGDVAGYAGSGYARRGDEVAYVSGSVTLDGPQLGQLLAYGSDDDARGVIVHELAHLLGLDHVDDPEELMHPQDQPGVDSLRAGDRAGLAVLGDGECVEW